MSHNILITGGSGYLGGSLLTSLSTANLPLYQTLYALVRNNSQADAMKTHYKATPITIDLSSPDSIFNTITSNNITIIFHLIDATDTTTPTHFIRALSTVKKHTGLQTHFLFTSGAKLFSSHAGAPTSAPLPDSSPSLYTLQKHLSTTAPLEKAQQGTLANTRVIEEAEAAGVRSYIFAPCIVYGRNRARFGNPISIQTVAVVKAARALRKVYSLDDGRPMWPVCHIDDNTALYVEILRAAIEGRDGVPCGRDGFYLAALGSIAWVEFYEAVGRALGKRGLVESEEVVRWDGVDTEILSRIWMAWGYPGEPVEALVRMSIGGACTMTAENGKKIGWTPKYGPEHILDAADDEVAWILENLED